LNLYFDTAYIAKCYFNEPGAAKIRQFAKQASSLNSSALCIAELACVIHRNLRERSVSPAQAARVRDQLAEDIHNEVWRLIPMTNRLLQRVDSLVRGLPTDCFLRSGDAIHLTSAIDAGFQEIWTNDRHLLEAASRVGIRGRSMTS
jgi:predicted nucleic acid-binding protein